MCYLEETKELAYQQLFYYCVSVVRNKWHFFKRKNVLITLLAFLFTIKTKIERFPFTDSLVPIVICLLIERGLSQQIIREGAGMFAHIINIMVLVLIPMVIIHVKGNDFSLSKSKKIKTKIVFFY